MGQLCSGKGKRPTRDGSCPVCKRPNVSLVDGKVDEHLKALGLRASAKRATGRGR